MKKLVLIILLLLALACPAWAEIIDHDEFEIPYSGEGDIPGTWCARANWSEYGLPDTQIVAGVGINGTGALVGNIESRVQPSFGLTTWLSDMTKDELFFRWYIKYEAGWSWWAEQNGQKFGRIKLLPEEESCGSLGSYAKPAWMWGTMVYMLTPPASSVISSDPEVYWSDYGPDKWICVEVYMKLNTLGEADGIVTSWLNGVQVVHGTGLTLRASDLHITNMALGDNIIYTNLPGSSGVPWLPPEEKAIWIDDFMVSTEYVGPAVCPDSVEITEDGIGICYCGDGSPDPDSTTGLYTSGYCVDSVWQQTACKYLYVFQ